MKDWKFIKQYADVHEVCQSPSVECYHVLRRKLLGSILSHVLCYVCSECMLFLEHKIQNHPKDKDETFVQWVFMFLCLEMHPDLWKLATSTCLPVNESQKPLIETELNKT